MIIRSVTKRVGAEVMRRSIARATTTAGTELVVVIPHPEPLFPVHYIIVPKTPYPTFDALSRAPRVLSAVLIAASDLARQLSLEEGGYSLVANGGSRRDLEQIHFHLTAGESHPATEAGT